MQRSWRLLHIAHLTPHKTHGSVLAPVDPIAAVPAVGGTGVPDVPEEMQGDSTWAKFLRMMVFALLLTLLIMLACFAR